MANIQHRENDGLQPGMSSAADAEPRVDTTALRSAIADAMAALECLSAQLAVAEHELERRGGVQEPRSGDADAGAPSRAPATRRRRSAPGWLSRGPRTCAVCRRGAVSRSKRELAKAGWTITGRQAICAQCGATGWRLAEQGGLPFRTRAGGAAAPAPGREAGPGATAPAHGREAGPGSTTPTPGREADAGSTAHVPSSYSR